MLLQRIIENCQVEQNASNGRCDFRRYFIVIGTNRASLQWMYDVKFRRHITKKLHDTPIQCRCTYRVQNYSEKNMWLLIPLSVPNGKEIFDDYPRSKNSRLNQANAVDSLLYLRKVSDELQITHSVHNACLTKCFDWLKMYPSMAANLQTLNNIVVHYIFHIVVLWMWT